MFTKRIDIKVPLAHLVKDYATIVWFMDEYDFCVFEDMPDNSPRWFFGVAGDEEKVVDEIRLLVSEGYDLINGDEEFISKHNLILIK